jgi:hypothetical protein
MKKLSSMKLIKTFTLFVTLFLHTVVFAQAPKEAGASQKPSENTGANTLSQQFYALKKKSNSYQEYKVIKESSLNTLWKNVQDSLSVTKKELQTIQAKTNSQLQAIQAKMDGQQAELSKLKQAVADRDQKLETIAYNTDRISVLGIAMLKENYIFLNMAIISALLLLLGGAIYKYRDSNKVAVAKVSEFESVKSELNGYKQRLRERETIMGRELQTERNKIEELNQMIASLKKKVH